MGLIDWFREKLNPAQEVISRHEGPTVSSDQELTVLNAYNEVEVVRRGVDMLVAACCGFDYDIKDPIQSVTPTVVGTRKAKLKSLLNFQPNLFQDAQKFRKAIFLDYILEGNIFLYYDGTALYHLPAANVEIITDKKTFVQGYKYNHQVDFKPEEILHVSDSSSISIYRGTSRLTPALKSIKSIRKMKDFQDKFFDNGAVPGLVVKTPNILSDKIKDRLLASWSVKYNPSQGGKRPLILDGGMEVDTLSDVSFRELDFEASITTKEVSILKALGVPPILLDGGNNANIAPNLRMFYLETAMPIVRQLASAFEMFFGYDIDQETSKISALTPDMREASAYYSTLVNGGVISPNEARLELRYDTKSGHDDLRIPANIAGSAADPSQGGKPKNDPTNSQ